MQLALVGADLTLELGVTRLELLDHTSNDPRIKLDQRLPVGEFPEHRGNSHFYGHIAS